MVLRVEALRERLAKLEEVVSRLREVAAVTRDDFLRDYRRQWLAERGLETCLHFGPRAMILAESLVDCG